jgi:predicted metal-dependent peptidase
MEFKDRNISNIAADIITNYIVQDSGFALPKTVLKPDAYSHDITVGGIHIDKIDQRHFEEIYDILMKHAKIINVYIEGNGKGKSGNEEKQKGFCNKCGGFDQHQYGESLSQEESRELEREWKNKVAEAFHHAKNNGSVPAGIERMFDEIMGSKVNWRALLHKAVVNSLPCDYTFMRPNRRSVATGFYMPSVKKEMIELAVAVDTSGSIDNEMIKQFMGEIYSIAKSFENIKLRVLCCDAKVHSDQIIKSPHQIKNIQVKGGGGTSFIPVFDKLKKNGTNLLIYLTDGYGDFPDREYVKTIWAITHSEIDLPFGKKIVVRIDEHNN